MFICNSSRYSLICLIHFVGFLASNWCISISFIKLLSDSMCLRKSILVFMSLFCNDAPISPLNALIAVHFLAFTVSLSKALFSSVCKSEICFFL